MRIEELRKTGGPRPAFAHDVGENAIIYFDRSLSAYRIISDNCNPVVDPDLLVLAIAEMPATIFLSPIPPNLPRIALIAAVIDKIIKDLESVKYEGDVEHWRRTAISLLQAVKAVLVNPEAVKGKLLRVCVEPIPSSSLDKYLDGGNNGGRAADKVGDN